MVLYYIDIDDILVVFLLLKFDFFIACSEGTIFIFHEDIDAVMVTEIKNFFFHHHWILFLTVLI